MPQLLPGPWFYIFISSWLIMLFLFPRKILTNTLLNNPTPTSATKTYYTWTWPWS
uniref:ATP synthase complex subunit 8 n=1 Tax=Breviceps mossambicus TaxID=143669 RepID=A0A7I6PB64_9NEOB|nr:ATPase subunit 8 [Breviceps mossambicus]